VENIIDYVYDNRRYIVLSMCVIKHIKDLKYGNEGHLSKFYEENNYIDIPLTLKQLTERNWEWSMSDFIIYSLNSINPLNDYINTVAVFLFFVVKKNCKCLAYHCLEDHKYCIYDKIIKIAFDYTEKYNFIMKYIKRKYESGDWLYIGESYNDFKNKYGEGILKNFEKDVENVIGRSL
jgi:hypothetical protein